MFDNNKQKLQESDIGNIEDDDFDEFEISQEELQKAYAENFDEEEDIILPDTYWGELIYIFYILKDIQKGPNRKTKFNHLIRQIYFHKRWMKVK